MLRFRPGSGIDCEAGSFVILVLWQERYASWLTARIVVRCQVLERPNERYVFESVPSHAGVSHMAIRKDGVSGENQGLDSYFRKDSHN